ncbi:MAG: putative outer capsid protein [uncultured marine phage]|uniref:Putative outer capsid protein n=1 Tax=uncultured marine phage TaxID=707152 RepID=A0A8D9C8R1_9VIRU|nr:MAG: putative outer capsid protein [uncultured marine phage]
MKSFFKKLDMKSWMILILLALTLVFGFKWYFSGDAGSKERIEQLEKENEQLSDERADNIKLINILEIEVTNLEKVIETKEEIIDSLDVMVGIQDQKIAESKRELYKMRKEIEEKKEKIEELKKNPFKRTGNDLLNSLKNKVN